MGWNVILAVFVDFGFGASTQRFFFFVSQTFTNDESARAAAAVGETNKWQRDQGGAAPARTRAATQSE